MAPLRKGLPKHVNGLKCMRQSALQVILFRQKGLRAEIEKDVLVISGTYYVYDGDTPYESYEIWIGMKATYPYTEPVVFETGGKIPKVVDRHVFPKSERCCLGVWEEWLIKETDHSVANFMNTILQSYFVSQNYYEHYGEWPFGERAHDQGAFVESFSEILGVPAVRETVFAYVNILCGDWPKGHSTCPCGSGKKLRNCHHHELLELHQKIPQQIARQMRTRLKRSH